MSDNYLPPEDYTNEPYDDFNLSVRELQVVALIRNDLKYKEIAEELDLSYETVKTYTRRIRQKLSLRSKLSLAMWAEKMGITYDEIV